MDNGQNGFQKTQDYKGVVSAKRGLEDIETEVALAARCEVSLNYTCVVFLLCVCVCVLGGHDGVVLWGTNFCGMRCSGGTIDS